MDTNIEPFYFKYKQKIDDLYNGLSKIMELLTVIPINLGKINKDFIFLNSEVNAIINKINNDFYNFKSEENIVLYINRKSYEKTLFINENIKKDFFCGEFEKIYDNIEKSLNE